MSKPKIGIFSFTSCEGCQLQILSLEDEFIDLLQHIEIVNFREAITEKGDDYQIAFVEGSITRTSEIAELKNIREKAEILIALGACAALGGINAMKNLHPQKEWLQTVYGRDDLFSDTIPTKRIKDVVDVDFVIPGCPIDKNEFLRFVKSLLIGIEPRLPNYPVCVECRSKGNVCLFDKKNGQVDGCLGSVTRAGCNAICPTFKDACVGCRGFVDQPNVDSLKVILKDNGLSEKDIQRRFTIFNTLESC